MRVETHDLNGTGDTGCEVYDVPSLDPYDFWPSVTDVPCPVEGCDNHVVWWEAGYVPGYRVCATPNGDGTYDATRIAHRFLAKGDAESPKLLRGKR